MVVSTRIVSPHVSFSHLEFSRAVHCWMYCKLEPASREQDYQDFSYLAGSLFFNWSMPSSEEANLLRSRPPEKHQSTKDSSFVRSTTAVLRFHCCPGQRH